MQASKYVGMKKAAAIKAVEADGLTPRVMRENDEHFMGTCDLRADRVNLEIDNGVVTAADIG